MKRSFIKTPTVLIALVVLPLLLPLLLFAQPATIIKGVVTDVKTHEPIPFVNITQEGNVKGTTTDFYGQYLLQTFDTVHQLTYSNISYKTEVRNVDFGKTQIINVKMAPAVKEIQEITIKGKKKRYRNKDNPAVELIRKVIEHKKDNRKDEIPAYQYEKYEKVQFALSNISQKFKNKKYLKKFQFIFDNIDTTKLEGKEVLPMYIKENLSDVYYRKSPHGKKEILKGTKQVSFYIGDENIQVFTGYLYQDIDIYKNSVMVLTNMFISPIADAGPLFYRYYISDTTVVNNKKCYKLTFYPRNKSDFEFQGDLYISADSNYSVLKDEMTIFPEANINFVKELKINQEYEEVVADSSSSSKQRGDSASATSSYWLLTKDEISIDFGIRKNGMGIFGQRSVSMKDFLLNKPKEDAFYKGEEVVVLDSAKEHSEEYWREHRHSELTKSEAGAYKIMDTIQTIPAFKNFMNWMILILAGYRDLGLFEIGPVSTFYSYNPVEGIRARFGGRTTRKFSPRFNFETYGAYGFLDQQWKYYFGAIYGFGKKPFDLWPLHTLLISYQQETKIPGQELQFVEEDNALLSIKRGVNTKLLYNKIFTLDYLHEYSNHFSTDLTFKHLIQAPGGTLFFNPIDYYEHPESRIPYITTSEFNLGLRYAPKEQFFEGKNFRTPMYNQYPILEAHYNVGIKGFLNSDYDFQNLTVSIFKRFYVTPLGYSDFFLQGGMVFNQVPYPLLDIHRANQTYSLQLQSYNLMNFLEFVSDRYVELHVTHFFNGFFFNKIPLFKRLKWREVATAKILYGTISDLNNPALHPNLFKFPVAQDGTPLTYSLDARPYIEVSAGIANVFKLFRIEVIRRITYLDHPNVSEYGLRARFKFDF